MKMHLHKFLTIGGLWLIAATQLHSQTATYTVQGSLTMTSATSTEIQLVSLTNFDKIAVTGSGSTLTLAGPLTVVLDGYVPNNADKFEIASFPGTVPTGTFSSVTYPSGMSTWMIDYGVLFPGKVTIYGPQALPVTWTSFEGRATDRGNELTWQTASEINSDYFAIEHSADGKTFEELDRVTAADNSSTPKTYHFMHEGDMVDMIYYRLRQVDYDGTTDYSKIIAIYPSLKGGLRNITIYPNPTDGKIQFSEPVSEVNVYDTSGRKIKAISNAGKSIDLSDLGAGSYTISFNGQTQTIIINK